MINSPCTNTAVPQCEYGKECCCGECSSSIVYQCMEGTWAAYMTDFCEIPSCEAAGRPTNSTSAPADCVCIALYSPVCGVDGQTYSNSCEAGCAGVGVQCQGECPCT
eukprot:TRINITY_DN19831_c0_g1_i1.p1 TRINITY_DN19831_c0_g1~~TRINITY_DN19831_c0_g1_i1.p1  ORF type:complete len:107 (+),score=24.31 TRINITY_DN19831_c0_g1_i1:179-499(+)